MQVPSFITGAISTLEQYSHDKPGNTGSESAVKSLIKDLKAFQGDQAGAAKALVSGISKVNPGEREKLISQLAKVQFGQDDAVGQKTLSHLQELLGHETDYTDPDVASAIQEIIIKTETEEASSFDKKAYHEIFGEKLYLGTSSASRGDPLLELKDKGVNHILIILPPQLAGNFRRRAALEKEGFDVAVLPIQDLSEKAQDDGSIATLEQSLPKAFAFLEKGLKSGNGTLVHCNRGKHRSPSVLIAFLMWKYDLPFDKAHDYIQAKRPDVKLPTAFRDYLESPAFQDFLKTVDATS